MMHRLVLVLVLAGSVGCGAGRTATWKRTPTAPVEAAAQAEDANPAAEGDAAWAERESADKVREAIAAWERALASDPENADLLVKLARGYYFLADGYLRDDKKAYLDTFQKGVDYAERALTASSAEFKELVLKGRAVKDAVQVVNKEGAPALYWYASNLGKWAKAKGFATTLGNKDTIRAVMDRCLHVDPEFFYGGPDRYFGAFFAVAPAFAGGDLDKSQAHFEKSLGFAPGYLATKVLMAELLATKRQDRALFERLLNEVLAAPVDSIPELVPEAKVEKAKARELLEQVEDKF